MTCTPIVRIVAAVKLHIRLRTQKEYVQIVTVNLL